MGKPDKYFAHISAIVETEDIGNNTRIWGFSHIMEDVVIGENCNIGEHCFIESGVRIGNDVIIKNGISIWNGVIIEDGVFLGPHIVLTNDLNPRSGYPRPLSKTKIEKGSSIGAGSVILSDLTIGRHCLIGAGSVVTKSVKSHSLVYGNPATFKKWVCVCGNVLDRRYLKCTCGKKYKLQGEDLVET